MLIDRYVWRDLHWLYNNIQTTFFFLLFDKMHPDATNRCCTVGHLVCRRISGLFIRVLSSDSNHRCILLVEIIQSFYIDTVELNTSKCREIGILLQLQHARHPAATWAVVAPPGRGSRRHQCWWRRPPRPPLGGSAFCGEGRPPKLVARAPRWGARRPWRTRRAPRLKSSSRRRSTASWSSLSGPMAASGGRFSLRRRQRAWRSTPRPVSCCFDVTGTDAWFDLPQSTKQVRKRFLNTFHWSLVAGLCWRPARGPMMKK